MDCGWSVVWMGFEMTNFELLAQILILTMLGKCCFVLDEYDDGGAIANSLNVKQYLGINVLCTPSTGVMLFVLIYQTSEVLKIR